MSLWVGWAMESQVELRHCCAITSHFLSPTLATMLSKPHKLMAHTHDVQIGTLLVHTGHEDYITS